MKKLLNLCECRNQNFFNVDEMSDMGNPRLSLSNLKQVEPLINRYQLRIVLSRDFQCTEKDFHKGYELTKETLSRNIVRDVMVIATKIKEAAYAGDRTKIFELVSQLEDELIYEAKF